MIINAGIWIDHHKAVVVFISEKGQSVQHITSEHDTLRRSRNGKRTKNTFTPNDYVAEDKRERKDMIEFNKFYDKVIDCVGEADSILILGPGEAKGELSKRFQRKKLDARPTRVVAALETADKMTDPQIAAHVRQHFSSSQKRKEIGPSRKRRRGKED